MDDPHGAHCHQGARGSTCWASRPDKQPWTGRRLLLHRGRTGAGPGAACCARLVINTSLSTRASDPAAAARASSHRRGPKGSPRAAGSPPHRPGPHCCCPPLPLSTPCSICKPLAPAPSSLSPCRLSGPCMYLGLYTPAPSSVSPCFSLLGPLLHSVAWIPLPTSPRLCALGCVPLRAFAWCVCVCVCLVRGGVCVCCCEYPWLCAPLTTLPLGSALALRL